MSTMLRVETVVSTLSVLAFVFVSACSDDSDGGAPDAQAVPDGQGEPDGAHDDAHTGEAEAREGSVVLTEAVRLDAVGVPDARGAVTSISFVDPDEAPGDTREIDGCTVTTLAPDDGVVHHNHGPVLVSGTALGEVDGGFACSYASARGRYVCTATDADEVTMSLEECEALQGPCLSDTDWLLTIEDDPVAEDYALVGTRIRLEGFGGISADQPFTIRAHRMQGAHSELVLAGVDMTDAASTDEGAGAYAITLGEGPDPVLAGHGTSFLPSDPEGEHNVQLSHDGSDGTPPFDVQAYPLGEDMVLATSPLEVDGVDIPHLQPFELLDGEFFAEGYDELPEVRFSCDPDLGGTCMPGGHDVSTDDINGTPVLMVSGRTTDADVNGHPYHAMPAPQETAVTFTCISTAEGGRTAGLSDEVIEALVAGNPTRIQTTVTHASSFITVGDQPSSTIRIAVGHSLTGYSDVPPEALEP